MPWIAAGGAVLGGLASSGFFGGGGSKVNSIKETERAINTYPHAYNTLAYHYTPTTGFSDLNVKTGAINIDPTGRNLNLSSLGQFQSSLGDTRQSLLGNQGAFMNARVNPLLEQLALGRGALQRETARTGVRGTFMDQALQNYDIQGNRALADERAIATNDTLNALTTLDQALFNAGTGVGTNINNQELAALGLSANTIQALKSIAANLIVGAGSNAVSAGTAQSQADQAKMDNILGAIGSGLSAYKPSTTTNSGQVQSVYPTWAGGA